jgi:HSP20 family protein
MTMLVRWDPLREAAAMHTELSHLVNGLLGGGNGSQTQTWVPVVDVWETEDTVVYAFDLPGLSEDKITIEAEDGALTVSAARERSSEIDTDRYHRLERRTGEFSRTVGLPQGVSEDEIKATYRNGVLEVRVPKPEQQKPKRISVSVDGKHSTIEGNLEHGS